MLTEIKRVLIEHITIPPEQLKRFFKTGFGDYAEHEQFIGVRVPHLRLIAKRFSHVDFDILEVLLSSQANEERLLALLILVQRYKKADAFLQHKIYEFYLAQISRINNWNLVDSSAHLIIGAHLWDKDRSLLTKLAQSKNMWERRIAIVSTWYFIRQDDLVSTFAIAELLLTDKHDLIHKATGWMLREAGKKKPKVLQEWLEQHITKMPKTMIRHAKELPRKDRKVSEQVFKKIS